MPWMSTVLTTSNVPTAVASRPPTIPPIPIDTSSLSPSWAARRGGD
ncbi:hypothetical protein ORI20_24940 [Mycobacterium sp. CVI_P3]|uniref:Uncharacterized protein n=1 Tax=Mycobacterium pinniadriaticum TaxID=2994102 RepID=A0ABT3SKC6_9MYCO|nr:hypothetical protein [Mycobacterium pinniadriaticum]MCX2933524.1 hypothetical protein [Mycobacterium pinniadriaticum]MCX2939975.1 hypothetical protein [Mycobacterium pinniadriaticum]